MKKILMYGHGGSGNHGCEAIVRTTVDMLSNLGFDDISLISAKKSEDSYYGIPQKVKLFEELNSPKRNKIQFIKAYVLQRVFRDYTIMDKLAYSVPYQILGDNTISLSVGGDTYCYGDSSKYIGFHNISKHYGQKTVLWGCSIEPELLNEKMILEDLRTFDKIVVRETLSYEAMKEKGLENVVLYPDPAFSLKKDIDFSKLPRENSIGINVSSLVINCEEHKGMVLDNYLCLIDYILNQTDMNISLIPHVVWENNDDRKALNEILKYYPNHDRISVLEDCNCMQLKQHISKLRFFIGARTHATIAAYSSSVPTVVVGYSIKSKGIAKDLFGTFVHYVVSVQEMEDKDELCNAFKWLQGNELNIKKHLEKIIPAVQRESQKAAMEIKEMDKEC